MAKKTTQHPPKKGSQGVWTASGRILPKGVPSVPGKGYTVVHFGEFSVPIVPKESTLPARTKPYKGHRTAPMTLEEGKHSPFVSNIEFSERPGTVSGSSTLLVGKEPVVEQLPHIPVEFNDTAIEILERVENDTGSVKAAENWFNTVEISGFDGKTAREVVVEGDGQLVLSYLDALAAGSFQ